MVLDVLHLVGSAVDPFYADLSRRYARDCLAANADPGRYRHHIAYVGPGGRWRFPAAASQGGRGPAERRDDEDEADHQGQQVEHDREPQPRPRQRDAVDPGDPEAEHRDRQ